VRPDIPFRIAVPAGFGALFVAVPLLALLARAPWSDLSDVLLDSATRTALGLTLGTSVAAVGVVVVLGTPLAYLLARTSLPGLATLRGLLMVPLILPPVVVGVALLAAFGKQGPIGSWLDATFGLSLPFTTAAVVLAHTFVALPFYVLSVEGALRTVDTEYDVAATALGADRWVTLTRVTLPMALPGMLAGMALAWARSIGEFGATITFAGNYPGTTQTFPLAIYGALQSDTDTAIALSVVLLLVSALVLFLLRGRWFGGWAR
jgi:molybdate transport system permease protein